MSTSSGFFRQRFLILSIYLLIALPWVIYGAVSTLKSSSSSPLDWVEDRYPPRKTYESFRTLFGDGDVLIASWQGCRIDDIRLDQLREVLQTSKVFRTPSGDSYFDTVQSGRDALEHLLQPPFQIPFAVANQSLQGVYIGKNSHDTLVTIQFNAVGLQQRNRLVPLIQRTITETCGVAEKNIWLSGPVIDGFAVDAASKDTMQNTAPLSAVVVLCLCILCVESPIAGALLFLSSLLSQAISLALVYYSGTEMTALLIVLPPLVQVISVAGGMHLIHYYFATLRHTDRDLFEIAAITIGENWVPFSLSAITTAIGMFSLALSHVSAVRDFGVLAGVSMIVNWGVICFFLPGALAMLGIGRNYHRQDRKPKRSQPFQILFRLVSSHASIISISALLTMVGLGLGLPSLNASVRIETLFASDSTLVQSYAKTESTVGPLVPLELAVTFPQNASLSYQQKVEFIQHISAKLSAHPKISRVFSGVEILQFAVAQYLANNPTTALPELQREGRDWIYVASLPGLMRMHYLANDSKGSEVWRVTSLTSALGDSKYNELLAELEADVRQAVGNLREQPESIRFQFAGIMPLVHNIQRQLLDDLSSSFLSAFAVIFAILALALGSFAKAAIAMLPNLFPVILLFGALGWAGKAIDIGTIMTASIAIGIAVDDTLHFLTMYEKNIASSFNRNQAIRYVYEHCGVAILNTTIVCVIGMAMFSLNSFIPTARFSWMMAGLLALAVIGDLILLPALLLSPLGYPFIPKHMASQPPLPSTERQMDP